MRIKTSIANCFCSDATHRVQFAPFIYLEHRIGIYDLLWVSQGIYYTDLSIAFLNICLNPHVLPVFRSKPGIQQVNQWKMMSILLGCVAVDIKVTNNPLGFC